MWLWRERPFGEVMGSSKNIYTGKVQSLTSQEKSARAALASKKHALNWSRGHAQFASWLYAAPSPKN